MILCLGTTPTMQRTMLFDHVEIDGVNRATEVREYASGKSVNVAKVLRTLGHNATATGFVGGARGALLQEHLDRAASRTTSWRCPAATRLCTTVIDRTSGAVTELVQEPEPVEAERVEGRWSRSWKSCSRRRRRGCSRARSPPGAPADFYTHWLAKFRRKNPQVIIDARGGPLREALGQPGVVAKCNREEFEDTVGDKLADEGSLRKAMEKAAPQGGGLVVTLGRDGAIAYEMGRFWRVRVPPIRAVSAVGSGDAFAAGLASGRHKKLTIDPGEALRLAAACGAANAMTPDSGWVRPSDLGEILPKVTVEELG